MQLGSAFTYSFQWIKYCWQHFVVYVDQAKSLFSNSGRFGGNKGYPVADVRYAASDGLRATVSGTRVGRGACGLSIVSVARPP